MSNRNKAGKDKEEHSELQANIKILVNKFCSSEEFISLLTKTIASTITKEFEEKIALLEAENKSLKASMEKQTQILQNMSEKCENMDQILRNKTIRIYGVKEQKNENILKIVTEILKTNVRIDAEKVQIEHCYRIGKHDKDKIRPIIVQFARLGDKQLVYGKKRNLKGSRLIIREDLSRDKIQLLKMVISKVGDDGKVWTSDGRIFYKFNGGEEIVRIKSKSDIENL